MIHSLLVIGFPKTGIWYFGITPDIILTIMIDLFTFLLCKKEIGHILDHIVKTFDFVSERIIRGFYGRSLGGLPSAINSDKNSIIYIDRSFYNIGLLRRGLGTIIQLPIKALDRVYLQYSETNEKTNSKFKRIVFYSFS